jgi:rhodanese-related sulfurtransferase
MRRHKTLLTTLALGVAAFLLLGAGGGPTITSDEAHALVKSGALLLDVRTVKEFEGGHLDGAVNLPVQELEEKLASLPAKKDQPIVVYCHSGRRSAQARTMLEKAGFLKVSDLGPMAAWK